MIALVPTLRAMRYGERTLHEATGRPMTHLRRTALIALCLGLAACGGVPVVPII